MRAPTRLQVWLVALVGIAAPGAQATARLFASPNGHNGPPPSLPWGFYEVNPTNAAVQYQGLGNLEHEPCCGQTGWLDITGQPGNPHRSLRRCPGLGCDLDGRDRRQSGPLRLGSLRLRPG